MRLSDQQALFALDVVRLVRWLSLTFPHHRVRFREVWRPPEMQEIYLRTGRSWTPKSRHLDGLAVDFALDIDGHYQRDSAAYRHLGEYWEQLSPYNVWGGRWNPPDGNHFERRDTARPGAVTTRETRIT